MADKRIPKSGPFEEHSKRYDDWFEDHEDIYRSELKAVEKAVPSDGRGIEIGVGSGRFSEPLSIDFGVDSSNEILQIAKKRDIEVVKAIGEKMPFRDGSFDYVLIVTTICFFDDPLKALKESARILKPEGRVIIGFIDKESQVGKIYQKKKEDNVFYKNAYFFAVEDVIDILKSIGFFDLSFYQTIFDGLDKGKIEQPKEGHEEGSFLVVSGLKSEADIGRS
ncbi:MAG: class I SAM-dependent methyltransferase [Candidatus Thermoplasmatota archaeon]